MEIQQEATFVNAPVPLTNQRPKASKAVHSQVLIADDDALVRGSLAAVLESEGFLIGCSLAPVHDDEQLAPPFPGDKR